MTENTSDAVSDALTQLISVGTLSKKVFVPSVVKDKAKNRTVKPKKKKKKKTPTIHKMTNDRATLVDDLFSGLDDSMRVKDTSSTTKSLIHLTKEAQKQRKIEANAPVSLPVATADGVFTKCGMERLVAEAKQRKVRQAKIAREKMRKKREEEERAAQLERLRIEKEKDARIERLKRAAEKREKHRSLRVLTIDEETKESNLEAQEDELEALEAMYPDEYVAIDKTRFKIMFENVTLTIQMPEAYPSNSPPDSTYECIGGGGEAVDEEILHLLEDMWIERDGSVVIFEWLEELKERMVVVSH